MLLSSVLVIASSAPLVLDGGVRVRSHIVQHHNATDHNPQLQSRLGILWGKNKPFGGKLVLQDARKPPGKVVRAVGEPLTMNVYCHTYTYVYVTTTLSTTSSMDPGRGNRSQ